MDNGEPARNEQFDFVGDEATFGTHGKGHGMADIARTGSGSCGMRDKRKRPVDERRNLILNKRLEQRPERDFR